MDTAQEKLADLALTHALAQGAKEVALGINRAKFIELKRREGHIETLQASTSRSLSIALYVDGRYSSNSTSYLEEEQVKRFIDEALAMTRMLAPDPHRALPDPSLYGPTPGVTLDLCDPGYEQRTMEHRFALVAAAEEAARSADAAVISATAEISTLAAESLQVHSNGFRGERQTTRFQLGASVTVRDEGDRRPEDHFWSTARYWDDLPPAREVGQHAARRALDRRGSRKASSQRMTVLVENRAAGRLLSVLIEPLSGSALQQHRSCFEGKLGQRIAVSGLTITDDPFRPRGLGSRRYDSEGLAARVLPIIDAGQLSSYFIDVYYGRKLGLPPTTGSSSNLILTPGTKSLNELIASVAEGILVTSFLGGNANPATGDFSLGISGKAIHQGQLAEPVSEMNITDNNTALWQRLEAVGNDPFPYSSWPTPSLLFSGVQFSGI